MITTYKYYHKKRFKSIKSKYEVCGRSTSETRITDTEIIEQV